MPTQLPTSFTLNTPRLRLRRPTADDIPHIFSASRYPHFTDGMMWDPPATPEELREPLVKNLEAWADGSAFTFTIELAGDATFIGRIAIRSFSRPNLWNLGFWTHPLHHRHGYMSEAAACVVRFGFETLHADEVEAYYATWNIASEGVLKKIGLRFMEYRPKGYEKHGQWIAENRMAITREQWLAAKR